MSQGKEHPKECGLTTLETRRLRGDQIEFNGYEDIDVFFTGINYLQIVCLCYLHEYVLKKVDLLINNFIFTR